MKFAIILAAFALIALLLVSGCVNSDDSNGGSKTGNAALADSNAEIDGNANADANAAKAGDLNSLAAQYIIKLKSEIIPAEGSDANFGFKFDINTFNALVKYRYNINLDADGQKILEDALNIVSPCCGAIVHKCDCGHDAALKGMAKIMIKNYGITDANVVREKALEWQHYFFPRYFMEKALKEKIASGEIDKSVLDELPNQMGKC
ncbi:MAG: hypothetical protein J4415_01915 [Candidatus Diapherotrites archaeon]|uniref:Uncharacterized protein n=1 Tax=Candidatus Iainarchaeum sp. TaxID=3101447 RepID=A0A8T4KSM5_9ARCH|nr:hypothetical protein [Candidatus Diapherotrites archaeon]